MSQARDDGRWYCQPCHRLFPNWEAILQHKEYMCRTGSKNHIHCEFCGQDFRTKAAENLHVKQNHPKEQNLDCPGCGQGPFTRLASLVSHIENGECTRIDGCVLDEMREKKLQFPRQLEALTKETVKNNYTSYVSPKRDASLRHVWRDALDSGFESSDGGFPELSGDTIDTAGGSTRSSGNQQQRDEEKENKTWKEGKGPQFAEAPVAQNPTITQLEAATKPSPRMVFESIDPHNPDNPAFSAARYYSDVTEQYICPKLRCGKCFKHQGQLVKHLRSPAHGDRIYRCPCCQKGFKTLTAISSHVESSTVNCRIHETDNYKAYLDQLTAGIVEFGKVNEDGTWQYKTTDSARAAFRGAKRVDMKDQKQVQW